MINMTERKKVLLINSVCGTGSTGRIMTGLYDMLTDKGYTCMIAYGREDAPLGYTAYRIGTDFDVNIHGGISRMTDRHGFYSKKATHALVEQIKEFDPDIIHLHNIHGYYLHIPTLFQYLKQSRARVVWTLHDCWSFTGHCTHFEYIGCNKWQHSCSHCEQLKEYPKSLLCDASTRNFEDKKRLFTHIPNMVLVTPSRWLKMKVEQSFLKKYPVEVIPTGLDLNVFHPVESDYREKYHLEGKFIVLGVANPWRERKGIEEFMTLGKSLSDHYKVVMIGLKDKEIAALPPQILGLPKTNSLDEMIAWYSTADAYANLSMEENFPTTNLESLACGTPVITYKAGGSPESITRECGYVVERCNLVGVMAALDKIRTGESMKQACLQQAKKYDANFRREEYYRKIYRWEATD